MSPPPPLKYALPETNIWKNRPGQYTLIRYVSCGFGPASGLRTNQNIDCGVDGENGRTPRMVRFAPIASAPMLPDPRSRVIEGCVNQPHDVNGLEVARPTSQGPDNLYTPDRVFGTDVRLTTPIYYCLIQSRPNSIMKYLAKRGKREVGGKAMSVGIRLEGVTPNIV